MTLGGWQGMKVIVTSLGHPHYNQVLTLVGKITPESGGQYWRAQLKSGHQTTLKEGEFKVTSLQD